MVIHDGYRGDATVGEFEYKYEMNFIFLRFMDVTYFARSGVTYFARDPLRSYFHEPPKNEIYFLNVPLLTLLF